MPQRPASPLWSSLALDRSAAATLQDQIFGYFRDAVLSGRLKGGARVHSSRVLAADHDVARITVVEAYDRLVAEGFLTSRPGSGLFVAAIEGEAKVRLVAGTSRRQRKRMPELRRNDQVFLVPERPLGLLPLSPGVPALDHFPWRDWRASQRGSCANGRPMRWATVIPEATAGFARRLPSISVNPAASPAPPIR